MLRPGAGISSGLFCPSRCFGAELASPSSCFQVAALCACGTCVLCVVDAAVHAVGITRGPLHATFAVIPSCISADPRLPPAPFLMITGFWGLVTRRVFTSHSPEGFQCGPRGTSGDGAGI